MSILPFYLRYHTYTLPAAASGAFSIVEDRLVPVIPSAKSPRHDGARALRYSFDARIIRVRGDFMRGPMAPNTDVRSLLDTLKSALFGNSPAILYAGRSDRYLYNAQVGGYQEVPAGPNAYDRIMGVEIDFHCPFPLFLSAASFTDSWSPTGSNQTRVVTVGGTSYAFPIISITVSGSGAKTIDYALYNDSTGKSFTLAGSVTGGDVIVVDTFLQTVTIGGVDKRTALFLGDWLWLLSTGNSLRETYGVTAISNIALSWREGNF